MDFVSGSEILMSIDVRHGCLGLSRRNDSPKQIGNCCLKIFSFYMSWCLIGLFCVKWTGMGSYDRKHFMYWFVGTFHIIWAFLYCWSIWKQFTWYTRRACKAKYTKELQAVKKQMWNCCDKNTSTLESYLLNFHVLKTWFTWTLQPLFCWQSIWQRSSEKHISL